MDLYQFMVFYKDAFDPKYFLLFSFIIIIFYDWKNSSQNIKYFFGRLAVISLCYMTAFFIFYLILVQVVEPASHYPQYMEDFSNITGLVIGLILCMILWKRLGYGKELIYGAAGLIAVSVPFTIISYFWNISGHVTYTAAPVIYLVVLDRRLAFLLIIPLIMIFNRPYVGAHTPLQSISGFILGTCVMFVAVTFIQKREGLKAGIS